MSVQFGRWNFDGQPVDPDYLEKVKRTSSLRTAQTTDGSYSKQNLSILYRAFHTTKGVSPRNAASRHRVRRHPHLGRPPGQSRRT